MSMTRNVKPGKTTDIPRCEDRGLFPEEITALLEAPRVFHTKNTEAAIRKRDMHLLVLHLLHDAWMRENELVNVRIEDIDLARRLINLKITKAHIVGRTDEGYITKSEPRTVDFSEKTKALILSHLRGRKKGYLLRGQKGRKLSTRTVRHLVNDYARRLGIQRVVGSTKDGRPKYLVHPHALREAGEAYSILFGGMDRRTAARKSGHGMRVQEMYYTRYHAVRARMASDQARRTLQERFGGG